MYRVINIGLISWIYLASLRNTLLRFWSVYDMLIVFVSFTVMFWQLKLSVFIFILQFSTVYILSKIVFEQLEARVQNL